MNGFSSDWLCVFLTLVDLPINDEFAFCVPDIRCNVPSYQQFSDLWICRRWKRCTNWHPIMRHVSATNPVAEHARSMITIQTFRSTEMSATPVLDSIYVPSEISACPSRRFPNHFKLVQRALRVSRQRYRDPRGTYHVDNSLIMSREWQDMRFRLNCSILLEMKRKSLDASTKIRTCKMSKTRERLVKDSRNLWFFITLL